MPKLNEKIITNYKKYKIMQPKLKPVKKEFADMTKKLNEAGKKAVQEMLKQPCSLEEAEADMARLRAENSKSKQ